MGGGSLMHLLPMVFRFLGFKGTAILLVCVGAYGLFTFKAPGDFAQAYVIAHEVGHHIQTLLGISEKVHAARRKVSKTEANKLSVRQELQADCLAGVWAHHANSARQLLEMGDIEEGLTAASAIGDDTLQKQSQGYVSPDSFTHGSSEQRVRWFKIGLESGAMSSCGTFSKL